MNDSSDGASGFEPRTPRQTTLYRCYGDRRALLYIGITGNPRARMAQHRDEKEWWSEVRKVEYKEFPDRESAEVAEAHAIRTEVPRYNRAGSVRVRSAGVDAKPPRQLITLAAAAEICGVHPMTIRRRISDGTMPGYRVKGSRAVRVNLHDVDALIEQIPTVEASS